MYKKDLDTLILNATLPKSILLFGDCSYQIQKYSNSLANSIDSKSEKLTLYFDEYEFNFAKNYLSQTSLFGDKNILILKSQKKINLKELKSLIEITSKSENSYFIFELYDSSDYKSISKAFGKNFVRFFKPNIYEALNLVKEEASKKGVKIDRYAIEHLLILESLDVALAINELDKFAILDREITIQDIDNLTFGVGEINLDDLIYKIFSKQKFYREFENILEREDEIKILGAIITFINSMLMFHLFEKINGFVNSKEVLGYQLPKHIEQRRVTISKRLNLKSFQKVFNSLYECELKLKTNSKIDKSAILYSTLMKLQTLF